MTAPELASREGVRGRPGKCVCENARRETEKFPAAVEFKIDETQAFILACVSKLERAQRELTMNIGIAQGHVTGNLDACDRDVNEKIRERIIETCDQQRTIFFDLSPEQKETK